MLSINSIIVILIFYMSNVTMICNVRWDKKFMIIYLMRRHTFYLTNEDVISLLKIIPNNSTYYLTCELIIAYLVIKNAHSIHYQTISFWTIIGENTGHFQFSCFFFRKCKFCISIGSLDKKRSFDTPIAMII